MDEDEEPFENFEEVASVNSEMRYLALELMKLASQRGATFEQTLREFIANTDSLQQELSNYENQARNQKPVQAGQKKTTRQPVAKE